MAIDYNLLVGKPEPQKENTRREPSIKDDMFPRGKNFQCPLCNYLTEKGAGTCRVYDDEKGQHIFCFACRKFRRLV